MPQTGRKSPRMEDESRVCLNGGHAGVQAGRDLAAGEGGAQNGPTATPQLAKLLWGSPPGGQEIGGAPRAAGPRWFLRVTPGLTRLKCRSPQTPRVTPATL